MGGFGWNWPNVDQFVSETWGWPPEIAGCGFSGASNIVIGTNPPFSVTDFLSFYPQFGGVPLLLTGTITQGSAVVTGLMTTGGVLPNQPVAPYIPTENGQLIAGCFPDGTIVKSVDSFSQITLSQAATVTGATVAIFNGMYVPPVVILAYIALASASLVQARWQEMWTVAMSLYINHWCTLWLRTAGSPVTSANQLAAQGLARGILVSKSAGGVSAGVQPSTASGGLEAWGSWTETQAGVQFITLARVCGAGPMLCF